jgi:hypothetical protein
MAGPTYTGKLNCFGNLVAPNTWWQALYSALQKLVSSKNIWLDLNGEFENTLSPADIAGKVAAGDIWVAWCGWPFYLALSGTFDELLSALNSDISPADGLLQINWEIILAPKGEGEFDFNPGDYQWGAQINYPYPRGLITSTDLSNSSVHVAPGTPQASVSWGGHEQHIYSCVAIPGGQKGGYFVYAFADCYAQGVNPGELAAFIATLPGVVSGQSQLPPPPSGCSAGYSLVNGICVPEVPTGPTQPSGTAPGVFGLSSNDLLWLGGSLAAVTLGAGILFLAGSAKPQP